MPPKQAADGELDEVAALCHLIMSCDDFKADCNKLTKVLSISQAKNVPRKINSIIIPHGFEMKAGKVIVQGGSDSDAAPATPKNKTSSAEESDIKTPASKTKKRATPKAKTSQAPKSPKTPRSKKRKIEITTEEDDEMVEETSLKEEGEEVDQVKDMVAKAEDEAEAEVEAEVEAEAED